MIPKIVLFLRKDIVKVFSMSALATFIKLITSFISVKVLAVLAGPAGITLLGQLNNFSSIFLTVSTGGISNGITKNVASNINNQSIISKFLKTGFFITSILSLLCSIVLLIGSKYFSNSIFQSDEYQSIIIIFAITIFFYSYNIFLISIINGYKLYSKVIKINIAGSIIGVLFTAGLSFFYSAYGALLAAVTFQSVIFVVTLLYCFKSSWFKNKNLIGKFDVLAFKNLIQYSAMAIVSAIVMPLNQLFIRSFITKHNGLAESGMWEGMNRMSAMYLMLITTSFSIYYLPRLSELNNRDDLRDEIRNAFKFIIPILLISLIGMYIFRSLIITILFDYKFMKMERLFGFQLIGDFFKIITWVVTYQIVAKTMTRLYIITEISFGVVLFLSSIFFINLYGNIGATIAYAICYFIFFIVMIFIFRKSIFKKEDLMLIYRLWKR